MPPLGRKRDRLKFIKDPENGKAVIDEIYMRGDLYEVFPENMPDILIAWARGYHFLGEREMELFGIKARKEELFTPIAGPGIIGPRVFWS